MVVETELSVFDGIFWEKTFFLLFLFLTDLVVCNTFENLNEIFLDFDEKIVKKFDQNITPRVQKNSLNKKKFWKRTKMKKTEWWKWTNLNFRQKNLSNIRPALGRSCRNRILLLERNTLSERRQKNLWGKFQVKIYFSFGAKMLGLPAKNY